jgi:hypothetical protein
MKMKRRRRLACPCNEASPICFRRSACGEAGKRHGLPACVGKIGSGDWGLTYIRSKEVD